MTKKKEQIKNKTWVKNSSKKLEKKGGGGGGGEVGVEKNHQNS